MKIAAPVEIPEEQISDLLCAAINPVSGSSSSWIKEIQKVTPSAWTFEDKLRPEDGGHWLYEYPMNPLGGLLITVYTEEKPRKLDSITIEQGLVLMAEHSPEHFADILQGHNDAITGNVFLNYCLLGEIVYS